MKRLISILSLSLLLVSMLSCNFVSASENSERDELLTLACEVYPEYAHKIKNDKRDPLANSFAFIPERTTREIVHTESRTVNANQELLYTEYDDGTVLLADFTFDKDFEVNDFTHLTGAAVYDVTIEATCSNVNGMFKLSNVKYTLIGQDYDVITDTGTASRTGKCTVANLFSYIPNETASSNAILSYRLTFQMGPTGYYSLDSMLTLSVGKDKATVTHIAY